MNRRKLSNTALSILQKKEMDINKLQHVIGKAEQGEPAIIRFFGSVNSDSVQCFNEEFLWLQNFVKPSKIIVSINSDGGSVIHGMSTFSIIQSCPIPVDCVIEGIAASMGSVIWAAGHNLFMHDYSILMIHNPFYAADESWDDNTKAMVEAFRNQLSIVYQKRFGMSKKKVKEIMDGGENVDGTYFDAESAVAAGFIPETHVIKTSKKIKAKVQTALASKPEVSSIMDLMADIANEVDKNKLVCAYNAILEKNKDNSQTNLQMEKENATLSVVTAQLGLDEGADIAKITNKLAELKQIEGSFNKLKKDFDELTIKHQGKEAEVAALQKKLDDVEASLKKYKDAEIDAANKAIEAMIDEAIQLGKIEDSAKSNWVDMAKNNFDLVKQTLESIPARDKISAQIGNDPQNKQDAQQGAQTEEEKIQARVKQVVGENFAFRKMK